MSKLVTIIFNFEILRQQIDQGEINLITLGYLRIFSAQLCIIHGANIVWGPHKRDALLCCTSRISTTVLFLAHISS